MPRGGHNKMPKEIKKQYYQLIRKGVRGSVASRRVGVSVSLGSNWFIEAGSVSFIEKPLSPRFFSQDDRIEIADGLARGEPVKAIAARIGKSYQSVYREISRNRRPDGDYQPWFAHAQAHLRRKRPKPLVLQTIPQLREAITVKLAKHWSPEQICRWLRRRYPKRSRWHLCWETIYKGLYQGVLNRELSVRLRTGRLFRHRRGRGRSSFPRMPQMLSIHQRPSVVERRKQVGHWEGDLIIGAGQRSAIATLVERRTRFTKLVALPNGHKAFHVSKALIQTLNSLPPKLKRTLTWDQGFEMYQHPEISAGTGTTIYFADAHSPWQRGTNENTNKLLRQYFPKTSDLSRWDQEYLDAIAAELNDRPRKCLNDRSPAELMRRLQSQRP